MDGRWSGRGEVGRLLAPLPGSVCGRWAGRVISGRRSGTFPGRVSGRWTDGLCVDGRSAGRGLGRTWGRGLGRVSGRAWGRAAGRASGRAAGLGVGRSILDPVIGLRLSMPPPPPPARLFEEGAEEPPRSRRSPRAAALGAIDAMPKMRNRKAGSSFMVRCGLEINQPMVPVPDGRCEGFGREGIGHRRRVGWRTTAGCWGRRR